MAPLLECFTLGMRGFERVLRLVRGDQWHAPTPCTEWDVRALVDHVVTEQLWAPRLLAGATLEDVGDRFDGDQLGDDPVAAWERASASSLAAFTAPGALDREVFVSAGVISAETYAWQMTSDFVIHRWDLARGIGADDRLDPELVDAVWEHLRGYGDALTEGDLIAPAVPVADDADAQTRLLGLVGRQA